MRKVNLVFLLIFFSFFLSGCDWVRLQLGMPTSRELAAIKSANLFIAERRLKDSILKIQIDSIAKLQADSATLSPSVAAVSSVAEIPKADFNDRFYVIVGSFKDPANSKKMFEFLSINGYKPALIEFKNGYKLVSAASFTTQEEASKEMYKIMETDFAPEDIWVYDTYQKLHIK